MDITQTIKDYVAKEVEMSLPDVSTEAATIKNSIPDLLTDLAEDYDIVIAGGMVTSVFTKTPVNDIDLYIMKKEHIIPLLLEIMSNATIVSATTKSALFQHNGQFINLIYFRAFDSIEDIFSSFDFTVVMGAYDIKNEKLVLHKHFLLDVARRTLSFNPNTAFPIVSMLRVGKYRDKGYSIRKNDYVSIVLRCMQLNISTYEELEEHIGGMYGINLSEVVDTTKPFNLSDIIPQILAFKTDISDPVVSQAQNEKHNATKKVIETVVGDVKDKFMSIKGALFMEVNGRLFHITDDKLKSIADSVNEKTDGKIRVYKFVNHTDDKLLSFYKRTFEYKVGEMVESASPYMWGGCYNKIDTFSYKNERTKALIEIEVDVVNIVSVESSSIKFSKGLVTRVMPSNYKEATTDFSLLDLLTKQQ